MTPIGWVRSPHTETASIPKGPDAKHTAEGVLEIRPELEPGLLDIEGFSHLYVIWAFHRAEGYDLQGIPPTDDRPHGVFYLTSVPEEKVRRGWLGEAEERRRTNRDAVMKNEK
jgi:tRNA (Thr-GGU) A37 N-methylase